MLRARRLGLDAHAIPLFSVKADDWRAPDPDSYDAVMMTSANAARHGGAMLGRYHRLPLYAVGGATADAARVTGFSDIRAGDGDGQALIGRMAADGIARALHFVGDHPTPLDPAGVVIDTVSVYRTSPLEPAGLDALVASAPVALLHSGRAAARFAGLVGERAGVSVVAISAAVAAAAGPGWRDVRVAAVPDDAAMLAIAATLCHQPSGNGNGT